jgi:O-methyltransferase domain/Dimerisation domain
MAQAAHYSNKLKGVRLQSTTLSPQQQLFSQVLNFWQARATAVAAEMSIADHLAEGPLNVAELAKRTSVNASALFRLLRALESVGIFSQTSPRVFANTETSEFLRKDVAGSQKAWILSLLAKGSPNYDTWSELDYSLQTEEAATKKLYGYDVWEFFRRNPEEGAIFNEGMRSGTAAMTPMITAAYDWSRFRVIADIGGGIGTQLISILAASAGSKGILYDQAHVGAKSISEDRVEFVSGDFFASAPEGADAYLLRLILHDWSDEKAGTILSAVRRAMKPTARLVVIETIISEGPEFHFGKWLDLQMMVAVDGRERTEVEFRDLLLKAGFELETVVPTASPLHLLIAKPV